VRFHKRIGRNQQHWPPVGFSKTRHASSSEHHGQGRAPRQPDHQPRHRSISSISRSRPSSKAISSPKSTKPPKPRSSKSCARPIRLRDSSRRVRPDRRKALASEYQWIIDPLDGTTNFIHGFPQYAVSIALAYKGQINQAVVYDVMRNEMFTASKGGGAFLNERRIRVTKCLKLETR
jgi:3'-phosphoadenosine 5'-phosphosulfate (PAPS) 3'-phosphatase